MVTTGNPGCWNTSDTQHGWNWTFWDSVLEPLIGELNAADPLAPALVSAVSTQSVATSDQSTEAISRSGSGDELWVIAARSGAGAAAVTISGVPANLSSGTVYTEERSIAVSDGSFTDDFDQWAVQVYRFFPTAAPPPSNGGGGGHARCSLGRTSRKPSNQVLRGRVSTQSPAPGKTLRRGGKVNLTLSSGKRSTR